MITKPGVVTDWHVMWEQVWYYRTHLDVFIEQQFKPIKLTPHQKLIIREIGNSWDVKIVCARSFGKTLTVALACFAICVLYPDTHIAVCSATAPQATLILGKLKSYAERNPNVAAELTAGSAQNLVRISAESSRCDFKNGSSIESYPLSRMRGLRGKVIVVDEAPMIPQDDIDAIANPIRNHTRSICNEYGYKDYRSKTISITSACEKSNAFYDDFIRVSRRMAQGDKGFFACALDYMASVHSNTHDLEYYLDEKARMPMALFDMEYGSIFVGNTDGTFFPYDLTVPCRTLEQIELKQPKDSKSRYVISLDIATSEAETADNSIITVVKFIEKNDGTFTKKVVYIRSFHGKGLDVLSNEMRKIYHLQFPNAERLIYDARGLGDSFSKFMDNEWVDPNTGKEYPPLVDDDKPNYSSSALPVLHPIRAILSINQRMASTLRTMLEKRSIEFPIPSRIYKENHPDMTANDEKTNLEFAVCLEADTLQIEMGNIVQKISSAGRYLYDTPRDSLHKDRYSSLAMATDYIGQIEEEFLKNHRRGDVCVGLDPTFY